MRKLIYQEIIYASSETGIYSGSVGFGIRTCTVGMDSMVVDHIERKCKPEYPLELDRCLKIEQILANPDIVYDYPPIYFFRTEKMNDGSLRYIFGRTVYIGVNYGFWIENGGDKRTGSNYISHMVILEDKPPVAIVGKLLAESKFLPHDYSCYSGNEELRTMLTGEPEFLEEKTLEIDEVTAPDDVAGCSSFIKGVVQMLKNRQMGGVEVPQKMYVKCPWKMVEQCLKTLALFPDDTLESFHYISNYMLGNGIPNVYDIAFVNEYNKAKLYEDNYITVDMFSGKNKNVSSNLFIDNIASFAERNDAASVKKLISFYLELKDVPDAEYELYYNVFLGAVSDLDVNLADMSEDTVKKLGDIHLNPEQDAKYWGKINRAVVSGLTSTKGSGFLLAVDRIRLFDLYCPGKIRVPEDCISYLTNILFSGRGNLGKIADEENISTLLKLVDRNQIPNEELFLSSLCESGKSKVWVKSLAFYYDGMCGESVLAAIFNSALPNSAIEEVIAQLFPLPEYADVLFDYFKNHTDDTVKADGTLASLVRYYGENRFSDFVWLGQLEPEFIKVAAPVIVEHFRKRVETDVKSGVNGLFDFVDKVGSGRIDVLNLRGVLKMAVRKYLSEPLGDIKTFVSRIEVLGLVNGGYMDDEIELLECLSGHKVPKHVMASYVEAALRAYPGDVPYLEELFPAWIRGGVGKDGLKAFVMDNRNNLDDASVEALVKVVWKASSWRSVEEKHDSVLSIIDNCGWGQKKVEEFCSRCGDRELEEFLSKSNKFFEKTARKVLKFLKK